MSGTNFSGSFSAWFLKKIVSLAIFLLYFDQVSKYIEKCTLFCYWFIYTIYIMTYYIHHDIITQPQPLSCHIINFIDHISSYFLSYHSQPHLFPSDHSPSHSCLLLKSIAFRFTIFGWTHITPSFNPIVISTF